MTNIIEKLARAIADAYDDDEQFERDGWLHPARAILQTLHDNITPEMVEAGCAAIESADTDNTEPEDPSYHWGMMWRPSAIESFQAMIATALKGERA